MSSASGETTGTSWVGKKPVRRVGGMSDALSIASDLGFRLSSLPPQPPPPSSTQEDLNSAASGTREKDDDLIRVLRELAAVQRKIADLEVELRGRKDDKNVAHLTHVSEMEKKCETLGRITTILKDVIQNKDRIIARLQQPYSLDCIPVEAEYQKQFSELLMRAASDYGALTASVADFQWTQNFKEPPSVWEEMLRPIPVALASCTRFFQAMSAMRESFATLQELRVVHPTALLPSTPASTNDPERVSADSDCMTPPHWRKDPSFDELSTKSTRKQQEQQLYRNGDGEVADSNELGSNGLRCLSWPPSVKKEGL
ncbi:AUGMIN subunit 2-like protein [Drosera capensis]